LQNTADRHVTIVIERSGENYDVCFL